MAIKFNIASWVLWIIGGFYTFMPHDLHTSLNLGFGLPHESHIAYGIIALIVGSAIREKPNNLFFNPNFIKMFLIVGLGTLGLDYLFHTYFTIETYAGQTNILYYLAKLIIVLYLITRLMRGTVTNKDIWVNSVYFTLLLSLYYRFYEIIGSFSIGQVAPSLKLGTMIITQSNLISFASIWFIAHSLVFAIPLIIWRKFLK